MTDAKPKRKIVLKSNEPKADPIPETFDDLIKEVEKTAEKTSDVSTFQKFIDEENDSDCDDDSDSESEDDEDSSDSDDDDDSSPRARKRTDDDLKNIRLIRNYRKEFPDLGCPNDDSLEQMGSKQLAAEVDRCRCDVTGGITVDQVKSIYFTGVACVEQAAPDWGFQLYGLTESLKQNTSVDISLRAATCEIKSQISTSIPYYLSLPFATAMAAAQCHFMNRSEAAALNFLNRPVKRNVKANERSSPADEAPRQESQ